MVLELKVPHGNDVTALRPLIPVFLNYVLSFIYMCYTLRENTKRFPVAPRPIRRSSSK
ncbi:DUF1211 domain-containing protein [Dulcicalothrix desertica]|nr:DUF1211 domain-containing protein [Dulcicalothrix desertica]